MGFMIIELVIALTNTTGSIEVMFGKILPLCYPFICSLILWSIGSRLFRIGSRLFRSKAEEVLGRPFWDTYMSLWNRPDEDVSRTTGDLSEPLLENNDEEENTEES